MIDWPFTHTIKCQKIATNAYVNSSSKCIFFLIDKLIYHLPLPAPLEAWILESLITDVFPQFRMNLHAPVHSLGFEELIRHLTLVCQCPVTVLFQRKQNTSDAFTNMHSVPQNAFTHPDCVPGGVFVIHIDSEREEDCSAVYPLGPVQ